MNDGVKLEFQVHFATAASGSRVLKPGLAPEVPKCGPKVPRVARLMALALRFDRLVRSGEVEDFAAIAELGYVTRARVSQIINLLNLAPDIQEAVLFLSSEAISERQLRSVVACPDWGIQRSVWRKVNG